MATKIVSLLKILFDPENPRHDPIDTEADTIKHLLAKEDVKDLAKSIVRLGGTSPLELMAVVRHPEIVGYFLTAEGNRRLCALKLLRDPDKAPTENDKRYFRELRASYSGVVDNVSVVEFDSFEAARPWVELRHDAPAGVGLKRWGSDERARFNKSGKANNPNILAFELIEYVKEKRLLPAADVERLALTTLTRFLNTSEVRSAIGITSNKSLEINVPVDEFERAVVEFFRNSLIENSPVNSRANSQDRKDYAERFRSAGYSPSTRGLEPYVLSQRQGKKMPDATGGATTADVLVEAGKKLKRNMRNRDLDKHVIPRGFIAKVNDPVFQRIFRELKEIDAVTFSFAATYLFRSILDQAALLFLKKYNVQPIPDLLHVRLAKVAEKLKEQGFSGRGMSALRKMSSDVDSRYSPDSIGNFVHGGAIPSSVVCIKAWDTFEPIMTEMVRQLTEDLK